MKSKVENAKQSIENVMSVAFFDKELNRTFHLYPLDNKVTLISGGIRIKTDVETHTDIMFSNIKNLTYNFYPITLYV